ncbi:MAG: 2Fe-2S iron-sulfur cluster binding domain-containing protein [Treponema sp.]|jgi:carbon-monoxide dehydrogenase small subunit|nr:2Fe-2S iron-sulfur cluster binding domain-containing protein [Treponema sp.]
MTIDFILNGEDVMVHSGAELRLVDILRDFFSLLGTKTSCLTGCCGACTVIFNGLIVQSCLIPAFRIRGGEIITIEGFSQTDEYHDIVEGFSRASLWNCAVCENGKILAAEALLERLPRPERQEILDAFSGIRCRCTDPDTLVQAVQLAADIRQRRIYGRTA